MNIDKRQESLMELSEGILIAVEGIDGTGKTSIVKSLYDKLSELCYQVAVFKEPTNETEAGKKIRQSYVEGRVAIEVELGWFIEDRKWDVENNILPSLAEKKIVILDRYFFSTACYQGARKNNEWESILKLNRSIFPEPNLTIIIDVDPKIAIERIAKERKESNTFEGLAYLDNVRELFLEIIEEDTIGTFVIIDGEKPLEEVITDTFTRVMQFIYSFEESS
ncbi:MAG TPA: dTMP kinase [candidate division Zixibacteria bacterium]|nr:dTMP kinase [candidate division Zixibacteria bacterium]